VLLAWLAVAFHALTTTRKGPIASWARPATAWRAGAIACVTPVMFVSIVTAAHDWQKRLDRASLVEGPGKAYRTAAHVVATVEDDWSLRPWRAHPEGVMQLAVYLNACTRPTDRVFMQDYLPQVIALARRGFAGGHADLRPGFFTSSDMQRLTIERLQRQSVPVVVLATGDDLDHFRESFPLVTMYLDRMYAVAGDRALDDRYVVRVLTSKASRPTGHYAPLDLPCFQ
jgi:hypothetical protein